MFRPMTFEGLSRGSCFLDVVVEGLVAEVLDLPVEVVLPEGGNGVWLCWSGWSAVVGVGAVGGPPDGDFTDDRGVQMSARRRPNGLGAVPAGVMSNVPGEDGDQLGPLCQVVTPFRVISDRLGNSG
jgi:hypothetical protein